MPVLDRLAGRVSLVVTRPDRPVGRSKKPQPSPVRLRADRLGLPVVQPENPASLAAALDSTGPFDLGVVVAYGMLLGREVLAAPRLGHINLHFSLLPRWRGAAPVRAALFAGDERTGVSLMCLDAGLDTGPVVSTVSVAIDRGENAGVLTDRLARLGAELIAGEIDPILEGRRYAAPQTGAPTYAPKIGQKDRPLDLGRPAAELARQVRALAPVPGAVLDTQGGPMKVLDAEVGTADLEVGEIVLRGEALEVGTAEGALRLRVVHPAGRRAMTAGDWWRGARTSGLG